VTEEFEKHHGGVSDTALISLVGSAFDEGRRGRDAHDVLARGRQLRRRKRAMPALGALAIVAASASLTAALTGPSGAAGTTDAQSGRSLIANGTAVNVDNAGFSVHTDATTGKVQFTLRQSIDADELKQILARAGVRTYFYTTTVKSGGPVPMIACRFKGATALDHVDFRSIEYPTPGSKTSITIDPSKMPKGAVLSFIFEYVGHDDSPAMVGAGLLSGEPTACDPYTAS
jgi:hypothetical protein